jgi:hypothetical protein
VERDALAWALLEPVSAATIVDTMIGIARDNRGMKTKGPVSHRAK